MEYKVLTAHCPTALATQVGEAMLEGWMPIYMQAMVRPPERSGHPGQLALPLAAVPEAEDGDGDQPAPIHLPPPDQMPPVVHIAPRQLPSAPTLPRVHCAA